MTASVSAVAEFLNKLGDERFELALELLSSLSSRVTDEEP